MQTRWVAIHAWHGLRRDKSKPLCACRIEGENETVQSAVDPLDHCTSNAFPLYNLASPIAFVLHPMEAVIIPQVRPLINVFEGFI